MWEVEKQASLAWGMGSAIATTDLMTVDIPQHELASLSPDDDSMEEGAIQGSSTITPTPDTGAQP